MPDSLIEIVPGRKLEGRVAATYAARGSDFVSASVDALDLTFEGIVGDVHAGTTRRSGGREPWYPRGTPMRNERQLSLVAADELAAAASAMEIAHIEPEWIGANLLIEGVERFSMLPAGTLLFFEGGATVKIDSQNGPCRIAGNAIARHYPDRPQQDLALAFPKAAERRRGLVAWVEKPGRVVAGETVKLRLPEQWIY
ncbi:MOSC domain-containing protein [Pararhizobium mangrovi]|nr:molybdenum cofactor sulfurase [Pararhizobium mangrovi]